jgi:hypothetical protein
MIASNDIPKDDFDVYSLEHRKQLFTGLLF